MPKSSPHLIECRDALLTLLQKEGTMNTHELSVALGRAIPVRTIGGILAHLTTDGLVFGSRRWNPQLRTTATYWTLKPIPKPVKSAKPPAPPRAGRTPEQIRLDADHEAWFAALNTRSIWHEARGRV